MTLQKVIRVVDRQLLDAVKKLPCIACGTMPTDPDHITTQGAGGGDVANNVWPLCRACHTIRHLKGLGFMVKNYIGCLMWLRKNKRTDVLEKIERLKNEKIEIDNG